MADISFGEKTGDNSERLRGVTAHITTPEAMKAIAFYKQALGAEEVFRQMHADNERVMHARLRVMGGDFMLHDDFPEYRPDGSSRPAPQSIVLHLDCEDADAAFERAVTAGARPEFPVQPMPWGDRYGRFIDPFGYTWSVASPRKEG